MRHSSFSPLAAAILLCAACSSGNGGASSGGSSGHGSGGTSVSDRGAAGVDGPPIGIDGGGGTGGAGTLDLSAGDGEDGDSDGGAVGSDGDSAGADGGAAADSAALIVGDDFVSEVKVAVDPSTATVLVVTWTQRKVADSTWLEFSSSDSGVMTSRPSPGGAGSHRDVVLGIPEKTAVAVRIVSRLGGVDLKTRDYPGTTRALPSTMPRPQLLAYDASAASPDRWLLGAVEDSTGGCPDMSCYYDGGLFWVYILDRQARVVWYWADAMSSASSAYPRVALDGEYLVVDKAHAGTTHDATTGVVKMTLDRQYYQTVAIPDLDDAIDVTADGSILYDALGELREYGKDGVIRAIWNCSEYFAAEVTSSIDCYSNTVNWVPADDTVLLSFPFMGTVVQVARTTGSVVGQYGALPGSYAFSSPWQLHYPHSPVITPQGTLLVSAHLPDFPKGSAAGPGQHGFEEFEIDRLNHVLLPKWLYSDGTEWAEFKGFNMRLANGNTLVNYGSGGAIREVTPDKKTVFHVKFDVATGDDYYNKMVGNTVLIDDLYALNGGPK
jgi:hypothetical protein